MKNETKLNPPIQDYFNKLKAFMDGDPEITSKFDYNKRLITLTISNAPKAAAWREILPETIDVYGTEVTVDIICDRHGVDGNVVETAMLGNSAFSRYYHMVIPEKSIDRNFAYMNPVIIQFENDNFGSPESLETRTAEDLAKELFKIPLLNFCTEKVEDEDEARY